MTQQRLGFPDLGIGVGLRTAHYGHLLAERPHVDFLEIISDNYMESSGRPLEVVEELSTSYAMVMHGVSLNLGGPDPIDRRYVARLVRLRDRIRARWVSDHLCFTGAAGRNTHDLLPLPLNRATLDHVAARVDAVQQILGGPLVVENPSTYIAWRASTMPEAEFLAELGRRTGCGLLVDVNNIHVSARNHGFDPQDWLAAIPWERVVQFHVAGHSDLGNHIVDTHDSDVIPAVWELLRAAWPRCCGAAILLERDADIPPFPAVHAEALRAREFIAATAVA